MEIHRLDQSDIPALTRLLNQQERANVSPEYLKNWYWGNPFHSHSIIAYKVEDQLLGVASTNNFLIDLNGEKKRVAFPQKIITTEEIRGKGYFSRLYNETERDNLESERVDFFLAFANPISKPIYLHKYKYKVGVCPEIAILPPSLLPNRKNVGFRTVDEFDPGYLSKKTMATCSNGLLKDKAYLDWRYGTSASSVGMNYSRLEVKKDRSIIGYAVLKKEVRKKLPLMFLLEVITHDAAFIPEIIGVTRKYALSRCCLGITFFNNELMAPFLKKAVLKLVLKDRLTFIVKGKTPEKTETLTQTRFNFSFGDLDFL